MLRTSKMLIIVVLGLIILLSSYANETSVISNYENILVRVNDDFVYRERVDLVYLDHEGTTVTYERIINDTILELLVVQQAPRFGISLSDEELQNIMESFEEIEPEVFNDAVETFGINELREKLRIRNIFSTTKDYVIDNILFPNGEISSETIRWFAEANDLAEQFAQFTDEEILDELRRDIVEFTFRQWMEELREDADIEFIGFNPSQH
ncbi:MAG: hypothetical protein ACYCXI_09975 [Dethiobacteraceae bacterium]